MSILSELTAKAVPGPGSGLDRFAAGLQYRIASATAAKPWRAVVSAVSGESWLGHPAHPAVVIVPSGLWISLYSASWVARSQGRRSGGRKLSTAAIALVGPGAYLGGELAYRYGVGQTVPPGQ